MSRMDEPAAAELKSGLFQFMRLKLNRFDPDRIQDFLAEQVALAPRLLTGAPLVIDLDALQPPPAADQLRDLLERARFCGVLPVAIAAESDSELALLAEEAGLPSVAPDRNKRQRRNEAAAASTPEPVVAAVAPAAATVVAPPPTMHISQPVRSGQQIYARGSDMVLTTMVSAGAEVIADGSIHVYGRLSGKALAGALGERNARIFCLAFEAELVSIAGHFRVFETVPTELKGRACHLWLNGDRLEIQPLS